MLLNTDLACALSVGLPCSSKAPSIRTLGTYPGISVEVGNEKKTQTPFKK